MKNIPFGGKMLIWVTLLFLEAALGLSVMVLPKPYYSVIIAMLIPIGMVFWAKPLLGILVMVFFLPNYGVDLLNFYGKADLHFINLAVGLSLICWFIYCIKEGRLKITISSLDLGIFMLFCWVCMSMMWTVGQVRSVQQILKIVNILLGYFLIVQLVNSKDDFRWLVGAWVLLALVVSIVGVWQLATHGLHASTQYAYSEQYTKIHRDVRTTAMFEGADMAGFLMSLSVVIVVTRYAIMEKGPWKLFVWCLIPLFMFILVTTISRKSYMATAAALTYMCLSSPRMRQAILSVVPLVLFAMALILAGPFADAIIARLKSFLMPVEQGMPYRWPTWEFGAGLFAKSPFIGHGLGAFYILASQADMHLVFPHNFFLYMLAEFGLVGMFFFVLWCYQLFRSLSKYKVWETEDEACILARGLTAGALVIFLHAGFRSFSLTDPTFWGYFGMCSAFLKVHPLAARQIAGSTEEHTYMQTLKHELAEIRLPAVRALARRRPGIGRLRALKGEEQA
jgi:O-antigen ligase